jgi:hypothetical protein
MTPSGIEPATFPCVINVPSNTPRPLPSTSYTIHLSISHLIQITFISRETLHILAHTCTVAQLHSPLSINAATACHYPRAITITDRKFRHYFRLGTLLKRDPVMKSFWRNSGCCYMTYLGSGTDSCSWELAVLCALAIICYRGAQGLTPAYNSDDIPTTGKHKFKTEGYNKELRT